MEFLTMTRRQRHLNIIQGHCESRRRWELGGVIAELGLSALTDEAIEKYAARCVVSHRREQKMHKANRQRREANALTTAS